MIILFHTSSSDPNFSGDCDYAVVDVTGEQIEEIRRRIALAQQLAGQDNDLEELRFWGSAAVFFDHRLLEACEEALAAGVGSSEGKQRIEHWSAELDRTGYARLPAGTDLSGLEAQRTEYDRMVLCRTGVQPGSPYAISWTARPRHCDLDVTTHELRLADLVRLVSRATAGRGKRGRR